MFRPKTQRISVLDSSTSRTEEASLWRRLGAFGIDLLIVRLVLAVLYGFIPVILRLIHHFYFGPYATRRSVDIALVAITWTGYFALMEGSSLQGTLGKKANNLAVVDVNGSRISVGRSALRALAHWLSALIFGLGFIMAAFTKNKQTLHDLIADTLVISRRPQRESHSTPLISLSSFDQLRRPRERDG